MCIPFAVSGILLFSVPTSWASTPKLIYVFITYNLVSTVFYTAINVPYSALNALMTQDPYERSVLSIFRNLLATAGTLTINGIFNVVHIGSMFFIAMLVKKYGKRNVFALGLEMPVAVLPCGQWFLIPLITANGRAECGQKVW